MSTDAGASDRDLREQVNDLRACVHELIALVRLRFLLTDSRLARLEYRDAPPPAERPPRRCRRPRPPRDGPGGACSDPIPSA